MTFFWPVKIFPLWKLGPESRGGILTTIEGQQTPLRLAGIIFMFCISLQANQHLLVFGNGFNLDDLHCHLFHEVQQENHNQYEERDIENYDNLDNAMSHLMSALLTISRAGRRRKMTRWGEDWANMQTILTMV